ncbi:hypothetical protein OEIGOIKO_07561 [Streptomyces chrestomyceticus JCM 4735]|uniref:DUF1684 domain-containing protein n=1 Tax=Streptomyces chrestomyceticus JCM 4735 TaxID=1306181 RepID=A0A7U9L294_9ACTN|nr:DUF1684 domain-containing protein [Streptomyces chrestomyceticus]GCD39705.1 hypothetical protein OEIGOIKO_07561 [Streptomyces chrestomyceticus JCM 4735]
MTSECFADDNTLAGYGRWRRSRWEEMAGPDGKAGCIAYRLITEPGQEVPGVPGRWTSTGFAGSLTLTAAPAEGVSVDGQDVDGTVELNGASRLALPGGRRGTIEELRGAHVLVVWDPAAPTLVGLRGIEAWPWDPAWIVDAQYRPADAGRHQEVTRLTSPRMRDTLPAPGDFVFDLRGERHTLRAFGVGGDTLLVTFTDGTSGTDTPGMGRWLILTRPKDGMGTVRIDLNRAVVPHHMFSAAFPCPLPPRENHLSLRVEAGERAPVFDEETAAGTAAGPAA